jgi:putative oxidoreductase
MTVSQSIRSLASRGQTLAVRAEFIGPLLARITVGVAFAESGWGKLHNLEAVGAYFAELGIPAPQLQAIFVSYVELIAGSLVLVGLGARIAALPLIGTMLVALLTARASDISGLSDLIGTIELCYAVLLAWIAFAGPGRLSIDQLIVRRSAGVAPLTRSLPAPLA